MSASNEAPFQLNVRAAHCPQSILLPYECKQLINAKAISWSLVNALIVQVEFSGKADRGLVRFRDLSGKWN